LQAQPAEKLTRDQKFAVLRNLRFFNDLADSEVWEVLRASIWAQHAAGDRIVAEGNVDDTFYIIVHGSVSVRKGDREISTLGVGDCFGEMGFLSKTRRSASIVAEDDVSLIRINSSLMERASLTCQLRFSKVFIKTLIERLTRTSQRLSG
jgi:CRP-like cAMP-binding protein